MYSPKRFGIAFVEDQLILPATLAEGTSRLLGSKVPGVLSRHFHRTCLTVTSSFNGTDLFCVAGTHPPCDGLGILSSQTFF